MIKLISKIDTSVPPVFYDPRFKIMIEQHLEDLKNYKGNVYIEVSALDAEEWQGNLYGYLHSQNVSIAQHWVIMRMNDMDSTLDFSADCRRLYLPDPERLSTLKDLFNTIHKI